MMSSGTPAGLGVVTSNPAAVKGLLDLLQAHHHTWAVQLGMQWLELVLRLLPVGAALAQQNMVWESLQVHQLR